jgi:hypothetical protein
MKRRPSPNQHRVDIAPQWPGCAGGTTDPMLPQAGEGKKEQVEPTGSFSRLREKAGMRVFLCF